MSTISSMFFGKQVKRSIRFNHDHIKADHVSAGLPWRIIDNTTGDQVFAKSLHSNAPCTTELVSVDGEVKGNIVVTGYFYHDEENNVFIEPTPADSGS